MHASNSRGLLKSDADSGGLGKGLRAFLRFSDASGPRLCLTGLGNLTDQGSYPSLLLPHCVILGELLLSQQGEDKGAYSAGPLWA